MPRHADRMKRWESFRYIVDALQAYIDRKPLRVETEPDWPLVVELASKQLVSPTIGLVLTRQPEVPDDVKEYFAAVIALNRERNANLESAIREVVAALNRAGMTPLLMKSAANLLDGLYYDPAARVILDIDVLVPADEATVASQVLAGIGYCTFLPKTRWIMMAYHLHHHLPPQVNEQTGTCVELHRELVPLNLVHLVNGKDAMARALLRDRGGLHYLELSPTDRVLHNIVHALVDIQVFPAGRRKAPVGLHQIDLRQMVDLALLINGCGGAIDWPEIRGRFASAGALAVLHGHVTLLQEMFGRDVPITVLDTAATATPLWQAIAKPPTAFMACCEISADYWTSFRRQPLLAINLLNPLSWPQRIRNWKAKYERQY